MYRRLKIALRLLKKHGARYAMTYSASWIIQRFRKSWQSNLHPIQVFDLENPLRKVAYNPTYSSENVVDVEVQSVIYKNVEINSESPLVWFVPAWSNVWGGGHFTIFRFAHLFSEKRRNIIFVYDNHERFPAKYFKESLDQAFFGNSLEVITSAKQLPATMIPIATTWQSVYSLIQNSIHISKKFYFMQDYESLFYAHGTQSMQALASYEQGLIGITGGPWLLSKFREHGGNGMNYMFTVDHDVFHSSPQSRNTVKRIFFYGRPSTERRCFELGIASLKLVKDKYPEIEIVIAGLDGIGDVGFEVTLLGSIPLPELGDLYRSCDIGLALSGTNLSYLPVELMACGVPVVSNSGPQVEWYCEHGVNSLIAKPFPSAIFEQIELLILNRDLREKIIENGIAKTSDSDWVKESIKIQNFIESNL